MSETIFCSNCSAPVDYEKSICQCGLEFELSLPMTEETDNDIINTYNDVSINYDSESLTISSYNSLLENYNLDSIYFSSSSAKGDYEKKVNYLKTDLLPKLSNWTESIQLAEKIVAKDKVEVYGKVVDITGFILKEFFGPFKVRENGLEIFADIRDFSKYNFNETIFEANLDFTDLKTVNFGSIGNDIMNSVGKTLTEGSFKELSNKEEWSQTDVKTLKTELGVAVAGQLLAGVGNMIGQTQNAIKNVREADNELNTKLEEISNTINSLSIEENEIIKQKRLFDKNNLILDFHYCNSLQPIIDHLSNDPIYVEYRAARKPFDYEQEIIKLDEKVLKTHINVSFWGCLLKNKGQNYRSNRRKRLKKTGSFIRYKELAKLLGISAHNNLESSKAFENQKMMEFKEFETINRKVLYKLPAIAHNMIEVKKFASVLKLIKTNIINQ